MPADEEGWFNRVKPSLDAIPPHSKTRNNGDITETRRFRGLTLDNAIGYLENLGGSAVTDGEVVGKDWRATLSAERQPVGPSYRLTTVTISWEGKTAAVEQVIYRFRLKAFRAPG